MGRGGGQNFSRDVDQEGSRTVLNPKKHIITFGGGGGRYVRYIV